MPTHSFLNLERISSYAWTLAGSLSFRLAYAFFHNCSGRLCGALGVAVVGGWGEAVDCVGEQATGCGVGGASDWAVEDDDDWGDWGIVGRTVPDAAGCVVGKVAG